MRNQEREQMYDVKCNAPNDDINTCILKGLEQSSGEQGLCVHSNISLSKKSATLEHLPCNPYMILAKHKKTKLWQKKNKKANMMKYLFIHYT